jgi:hypothetical protein
MVDQPGGVGIDQLNSINPDYKFELKPFFRKRRRLVSFLKFLSIK